MAGLDSLAFGVWASWMGCCAAGLDGLARLAGPAGLAWLTGLAGPAGLAGWAGFASCQLSNQQGDSLARWPIFLPGLRKIFDAKVK